MAGGGGASGNVVVNNTVHQASNGRWALNIQDASVNNTVFNNILITDKGNEVLNRTPYCQKMLGKGSCDGPCCER